MGTRWRTGALVPFLALSFLQVVSVSAIVSQRMGNITFECPDGFEIQGPDCYLLVEVVMHYDDAQNTCTEYGASLVHIRDEVEAKDVGQMVHTHKSSWDYYWISNIVNDSDAACAGFWAQGEPQDVTVSSGPIYVAANSPQGRWKGRPKNTRLPFVCRTDACVEGTFRCRNGEKCLSNRWTCDNIYDCGDQSDESDCPSRCSHYLYGASGRLNENSGYSDNQACTWVIEGPPGKPLSIVFSTVDVEQDVDYVEVWTDTPSVVTSTLQARLTGSLTNRKVYGYNNFLIVRLVSDLSEQGTGFVADWAPDDELSHRERQVHATDEWTELTSPYIDSNSLPTSYVRQFTVTTEEGSIITMEVLENDLGKGFEYDPETLSNINGENIFPDTYMSISNTFTFILVSNGCEGAEKFRARVKKGCAANFTRSSGFVLPPNFDNHSRYPSSVMCSYIISAPPDVPQAFQVSFSQFQLADNKDIVKVFDGSDNSATELTPAGGFTANSVTNETIFKTTSSTFYVWFESGLVQTDGFFRLNFNQDCPAIPNTANMVLSSSDTHYGSEVSLSCSTGFAFEQEEYVNQPEIVINCGLDGKWSVKRLPTCAVIYCGVPESISNGHIISGSGKAMYNETVTYECYEGFRTNDPVISTCGDGSSWTAAPSCETLQCDPLSDLTNGEKTVVNGTGNSFGSVVEYSCHPGYDLVGFSFTLCKNGSWSKEAPVCQRILCPIPEVNNVTKLDASDPLEFEQTLTVTCNSGYIINGTDTETGTYSCLQSGDFDIGYDVCVDNNECEAVTSYCGNNEQCVNTEGSHTCDCKDNYQRNGSECQVINKCEEETSGCDLANGYCNPTDGGLSYECMCNMGYVLFTQNGTSGRYVPSSEDGNTPGDVYYFNHTCVPQTCDRPPNISYGQVLTVKTLFDYEETVEYRCDFGYKLITNSSSSEKLTCSAGNKWEKSPPECERQSCGPLMPSGLVLNIYPNTTTYPDDRVVLECDSESDQPYNKTLFCAYHRETDAFRLQGDSPHCPAIDCGNLVILGGAEYSLPSQKGQGSSFVFSCAKGFEKQGMSTLGSDNVTCEKNGRWGLGNLTCVGERCIDPGTPGGMNQTSANFEVEGMVEYSCQQSGFVPEPKYLTCVFNSTSNTTYWNSSLPTCKDVEPPVFQNCSMQLIKLKLYSNPMIKIPLPEATDNSGLVRVTVSPKWFSSDVALHHGTYNVTYTATDAAGNSKTCDITVQVNDPANLPELDCPEYLRLDFGSTSQVYNLKDDVSTDSDSTLSFSPGPNVNVEATLSRTVYRVTATNRFGFQRQCAFVVDIKPKVCLPVYISSGDSSENADVSCSNSSSGTLNCTISCKSGFAFHDGSTSVPYNCEGENVWTPSLPVQSCVAFKDPGYEYVMNIVYVISVPSITGCLSTLSSRLQEQISQEVVNGCSASQDGRLQFDVRVEFPSSTTTTVSATAAIHLTVNNSTSLNPSACGFVLENLTETEHLFDVSSLQFNCSFQNRIASITRGNQIVVSQGNNCPSGHVLTNIGSGSTQKCVPCEPGFYANDNTCSKCPEGQYQDLQGQTLCRNCTNDGLSFPQCADFCFAGFLKNESVSAMPALCNACPEDTFQEPNLGSCTPCNGDETTSGMEGATYCKVKCGAGMYPVNSTDCAACPKGYYKISTGNTACTPCSVNKTTTQTGVTEESDCVPIETLTCENGGSQSDGYYNSFCDCPDGYSGKKCQDYVNACVSSPCYNGGTCSSSHPHNYNCSCPIKKECVMTDAGISLSDNSDIIMLVEESDFNTCKQHCLDNDNCIASYITSDGTFCILLKENFKESEAEGDGATKMCNQTNLFGGSRCEEDLIDNCIADTCVDQSFCRDLVDDADCVCPSDNKYQQPRCDENLDVCSNIQCKNGAKCQNSGNGVRATCICPAGFTGDECETNIDECEQNLDGCLYGGTCVDGVNGYSCNCLLDDSGQHCENKPDFCSGQNPCSSGYCYSDYNVSAKVCVCEFPYEHDMYGVCGQIDVCEKNDPCQHASQCEMEGPGVTSCGCLSGYHGSLCQHDFDDCSADPCVNGKCLDQIDSYKCVCRGGYEGVQCENNTDDCLSNSCNWNNTVSCEDFLQDYKCICKTGFTGKLCEEDINECLSLPCKHNGTCEESSATPGQYTCTCPDGWMGQNCECVNNYCSPNPCNNSGSCFSLQDDFFCNCASGTFGRTCDIATKLCDFIDPCAPTSSCQEDGGTAECECPSNYTGSSCNQIEDSCSNSPCQNQSTCVPLAVGYICQCAEGYSGERCTEKASPCDTANCPSDSTCIVEDDKAICVCNIDQLRSGSRCKGLSSNFDVYFTKPGDAVCSYQPFNLTMPGLSITFWVAPLEEGTEDAAVQLKLSNDTTVLSLDKANVTFGSESPVQMKDDFVLHTYEKEKWNHVTVTWNSSGNYDIILNGNLLNGGSTSASFPPLHESVYVCIGANFSGYISQLYMWQTQLSYLDVLAMFMSPQNPSQPDDLVAQWGAYRLSDNLWSRLLSPSSAKRDRKVCAGGLYDNACNNFETEREVPDISGCPEDSSREVERLIQIADIFNSVGSSTNLEGTLLTFGAYRVVFMKTDDKTNVAFCRFSAYVKRQGQSCDNTEGLDQSHLTACGSQGLQVQCGSNAMAPLSPSILTCGKLGSYNLAVPHQLPNAIVCGAIGTRKFQLTLTMEYLLGISCIESSEDSVEGALVQKVKNLNVDWPGVCFPDSNCNNADVTAKCKGSDRMIAVTIVLSEVPTTLTHRTTNVELTAKELLQTASLELDTFVIQNILAAQLQKDTVEITAEPSCDQGHGLFGDTCVECTAGSFLNTTTKKCQLCPIGTYTDAPHQAACSQCPEQETTLQLGAQSCKPMCNPGSYLDENGACKVCRKNFYQSLSGQRYCLSCPPGTATETSGTVNAVLCIDTCDAGTELKNATCEPCPRGFFRDGVTEDQEVCEKCPVGNITEGIASTSKTQCYQTACDAGKFRNSTTNLCQQCDFGSYQPEKWQDSCKNCSEDYTTSSMGSTSPDQCLFVCDAGKEKIANTSCTPCEIGYYRTDSLDDRFKNCSACNSNFTTEDIGSKFAESCNIRVCSAGSYRNETDNTCNLCPIGEYQPKSLQTECFSCPRNRTTAQEGRDQESQCKFYCAAGYKVSSADNETCTACERGFFKTNEGDKKFGRCEKCGDDKTTESPASESESLCSIPMCSAGQEISVQKTCSNCPLNTYQPVDMPRSTDKCQTCPNGTGTKENKQDSESSCLPVCDAGQQYSIGSSSCQPCPMGTWNSGNSSQRFNQCAPCPLEYVTVNEMTGASSIDKCTLKDCPAGQFINKDDNDACTPCPMGQYQDLPRKTVCIECPENTNTSGEGQNNATDCTIYCDLGLEQVSLGSSECKLCDEDYFKPHSGHGSCDPCRGNYTSNPNRTTCDILYCDRGYESDGSGNCHPCGVGKYKANRGNDDTCEACPLNTTTSGGASTSVNDCNQAHCEAGFYSVDGSLCLPCSVGQYKNSKGNDNCTACGTGNTTQGIASTSVSQCSIVVCPVGQFRNNANECDLCAMGSYQDESGQTQCKPCSPGHITIGQGSNSSDDCRIVCSAGQFRNDNTNMCDLCSKGEYQDTAGKTVCKPCGTNYTTAVEASTQETDCFILCAVGQYNTSRTTCQSCAHGTFQNASASTSCDNCPQGEMTLQMGSDSADDCMPICAEGKKLDTNTKTCKDCPLGTYNPDAGTMTTAITQCQNCTKGNTTSSIGSTSQSQCNVVDCQPGFYRSDQVGCEECPLGQYQPQYSQGSCIPCTTNLTTLKTGRKQIESCVIKCNDGQAYNILTESCYKCAIGFYRDASNITYHDCIMCPPGTTTLKEGMSNCIPATGGTNIKPPRKITIKLTIVFRISFCNNKFQVGNACKKVVLSIIIRLSKDFPDVCTNAQCTNLQIKFKTGCLQGFERRRKRDTDNEQEVELTLTDINDTIKNNATDTFHQSPTAIQSAFYDIQPEQATMEENQIELIRVSSGSFITTCQPGEYSDVDMNCNACPVGTFSTYGLSCVPCDLNRYQNSTGQASCLPCPHKLFTTSNGSTQLDDCTKKCDKPNAVEMYCSGHGVCKFDDNAIDGVRCMCDENYVGDDCRARQVASDDKTNMIAGIAAGAGALLFLVLIIVGIVACLKRAANKGKKGAANGMGPGGSVPDNSQFAYADDGTSDRFPDYNYPLYDNSGRNYGGRPAIMYMNPAADQDVRDFYTPDKSSNPPSRTRSRSYASGWQEFDGAL